MYVCGQANCQPTNGQCNDKGSTVTPMYIHLLNFFWRNIIILFFQGNISIVLVLALSKLK